MNQTNTPKDIQKEITDLMKVDLSGGRKTRFSPYIKDNEIILPLPKQEPMGFTNFIRE